MRAWQAPIIESIKLPSGFPISILHLEQMHPLYGGNKWFKLKYNMPSSNQSGLLTFGGAHSNHIHATAAYCYEQQIPCMAIIRGEENELLTSPTLQFAKHKNMALHFVTRRVYKTQQADAYMAELIRKQGSVKVVPEGGNNAEGVKGCMEIVNYIPPDYEVIFCACGTATTFSGILAALPTPQTLIGISVLKGENELLKQVNDWREYGFNFEPITASTDPLSINHSTILNSFHQGGYAKHTPELLAFKKQVEQQNKIVFDYVYTAKVLLAIETILKAKPEYRHKRILMLHSGGLQGNAAYERRYGISTH